MSRHITKCKWCQHGAYSYKYGEWNCWYDERPLTDAEAKHGYRAHFKPNKECPDLVCQELGLEKEIIGLFGI